MDELIKGLNCFASLLNDKFVDAELQRVDEIFGFENHTKLIQGDDKVKQIIDLIENLLSVTEEKKLDKYIGILLKECNKYLGDLEKNIQSEPQKLNLFEDSCTVVGELKKILTNEKDKPSIKIRKFEDFLNQDATQTTLKANPESSTVSFLKKLGYILLNIATIAIVHAVTRGLFLFSPQQQLSIEVTETLAAAKKELPKSFRGQ
jgi:hypothetical protein